MQKLLESLDSAETLISDVKTSSQEVLPSISQHDQQLVQDHISTLDKKLSAGRDKAQRHLDMCEETIESYSLCDQQVSALGGWMVDMETRVQTQPAGGLSVADAQHALQLHNTLLEEIDSKQAELESLSRQAVGLNVSPSEKEQLEESIKDLHLKHQKIKEMAADRKRQLTKGISDREVISRDLERVETWLEEKSQVIQPLSVVPLKTATISKAMDTHKSLLSEVRMFGPTLERLHEDSQRIHSQTDGQMDITDTVKDVEEKYESLKTTEQSNIDKLQSAQAKHKQLEADILKIELWVKEATSACSRDLSLDVSIEQLNEQLKKYQNLANSGKVHEASLQQINSDLDDLKSELSDADMLIVKEEIAALKEKFERVWAEVQSRLSRLQETCANRTKFESETRELARLVQSSQEELKHLSRGIGPKQEDSQNMYARSQGVQDSLVDFAPRVSGLQQMSDEMRALGQSEPSEEQIRLTAQYHQLVETAALQQTKLNQASALREQYHAQRAEMETCLRQMQEQGEAVDAPGVSVHAKRDRYKTIIDTLKSKEANLSSIEDKGKQIAIECTPVDARLVTEQITSLRDKAKSIRQDADQKLSAYQRVIAERTSFDQDLDKVNALLRAKEASLGSQSQLSIDCDSVKRDLEKLQGVKEEVAAQVSEMQEDIDRNKSVYSDLDEVIPLETQDKIQEFDTLQEQITSQLSDREMSLQKSLAERLELQTVQQDVQDWLSGAETLVQGDYTGVKFDNIEEQIREHQEVFSPTQPIQRKMDRVLDLSEQISPTLDINDKTTLKESLASLGQKVGQVTTAAEAKLKQLQTAVQDYHTYQTRLQEVEGILSEAEGSWTTMPEFEYATIEQARDHLLTTQEFVHGLSQNQPKLTALNEHAQKLQNQADPGSRSEIAGNVGEVNKRWSKLSLESNAKMQQLKDVVENWSVYEDKLGSMQDLLDTTQASLTDEGYQTMSISQLEQELDKSSHTSLQISGSRQELGAIQKAAQEVLTQLPPGAVKSRLQKQLLGVQDSFEQLEWKAREQQRSLESEINEREDFIKELESLKSSLETCEGRLQLAQDGDTEARMATLQSVKDDVELKSAELDRLVSMERDRYQATEQTELPTDLRDKIQEVERVREEVINKMKKQDDDLTKAQRTKHMTHVTITQLSDWLDRAEQMMSVKPQDLKEGQERHQTLSLELSENVTKLEELKRHLEDLATTLPPGEQDEIRAKVQQIDSRIAELQKQAEVRSRELGEASELWQLLEDGATSVEDWTERAHKAVKSQIVWDSLDRAEEHVGKHKTLSEEAKAQEAQLADIEALVEKLEALGMDPTQARARVEAIRELYAVTHKENTQRHAELESALSEWQECKKEMDSITQWAEETREVVQLRNETATLEEQLQAQEMLNIALSGVQLRNKTATLEEQLQAQEQVIKDLEREESRIKSLADRQAEITGCKVAPSLDELAQLKEAAIVRKEEIRQVLNQQKVYEAEKRGLKDDIDSTVKQLKETPVGGANVEALRQQIAERDALTSQVQTWQRRVEEINMLSGALAEETKELIPIVGARGAEISDTESEQGLRFVHSSMSTESANQMDRSVTLEESSRDILDDTKTRESNPVKVDHHHPESDQVQLQLDQIQKSGDTSPEDIKTVGTTKAKSDTVDTKDTEEPPKEQATKDRPTSEAHASKNERPASPTSSVHSNDTDILMHECDESVKKSSSESAGDNEDYLSADDADGDDIKSQVSETSTIALISALDEAMNTDQTAMSFDSLASSTSTVTIDGQVVANPPKNVAQWSGVPVLTSTGSLESAQVFEWQASSEVPEHDNRASQHVRKITTDQQLETDDTMSDLSISTIESDPQHFKVVPGPMKHYDYLEKLDTPRTPRTDDSFARDDTYSRDEPRTLSVMSPISGDQSFGSEFVAIPYLPSTTSQPSTPDISPAPSLTLDDISTADIPSTDTAVPSNTPVHEMCSPQSSISTVKPNLNSSKHSADLLKSQMSETEYRTPATLSQGSLTLADLDTSHNSLQSQPSSPVAEVTLTLKQQEELQSGVASVNEKLGTLERALSGVDPAKVHTLDSQLQQTGDVILDLDLVETELARLKDDMTRALQSSTDPQAREAQSTMIRVLSEKYTALRQQAQDKHKLLKQAQDEREAHSLALARYNDKVKDFEAWLTQARNDNAGDPSLTHDKAYLKEQLRDNQKLQAELTARLSQLNDMAVDCESLCDQQSPAQAENTRAQLEFLKHDTQQLKMDASNKRDRLEDALKECDKRREDLDSYKKSVENLQKWIEETKRMSEASPPVDGELTANQQALQQGVKSGVQQGQALVKSLSQHAVSSTSRSARSDSSEDAMATDSDDRQTDSWRRLRRQLSEKNRQLAELQESIDSSRPAPHFVPSSLHHLRHQSPLSEADSNIRVSEVRQSLSDLKSCWDNLQGQIDDKNARMLKVMEFQTLYQNALQNISSWLDEVELKLFASPYDEDTDAHLAQSRSLQEEIRALQGEISLMNQASQQLMVEASSESRGLIREAVDNLNLRLRSLETQAKDREAGLKQHLSLKQEIQLEAANLLAKIKETRQCYDDLAASECQLEQKLNECRRLESRVKDYEHQVSAVVSRSDTMGRVNPRSNPPHEVSQVQTQWIQLKHVASELRGSVERALAVQTQYERMLEEYTEFLETAQGKLRSEAVSAMDLKHIQHQVKAHQEFFADLESHRAMLDALRLQVDPATRQKYQPSHTRLNNLTLVVQDKAVIQGQKLERMAREWADFDIQFKDTRAYIRRMKQMAPKQGSDLESSEDLRKKIWDYTTMDRSLSEEKPAVLEVLDRGRHLLQGLSCPALESQVNECTDDWVKLDNDTRAQLKRLQTEVDQLVRFERDAATLETWLTTATNRVKILSSLDDPELQSLGAIKQKMELFLDFRKEVESKKPVKNEVIALGNQLLRYRPRDYAIQRRLDNIEESWLQLMYQLPNNEEQLHTAQMELLPSRQALNELLLWLERVAMTLKEEAGQTPSSLVDVQVALRKYKDLKVDLANKQLTVDFVNQSAADTSLTDSNDRNDFSEKLGQMNGDYTAVSAQVVEKLKSLEMLLIRWEDYDKAVKSLDNWFINQEGKLSRFERVGHLISVQHSLRECKEIQEQLRRKESEIDKIKAKGQGLLDPDKVNPNTLRPVLKTVGELNQKWAEIDQQLYRLQSHLEDALRLWEEYHSALGKVTKVVTQAEYSLHRYRVASGDLQTFDNQIQQVQNICQELGDSKPYLDQLQTSGKSLTSVVDTLVGQHVDRTIRDSCAHWQEVQNAARDRLDKFRSVRRDWEGYENEFNACRMWIEGKEADVNALLRQQGDEPRVQLQHAKGLQTETAAFRDRLVNLGRHSDHLTPDMDNATVIHLTSRETTLVQRLHNVQQALSRFTHSTQTDANKHAKFDDAYDIVNSFLIEADHTLAAHDPDKSSGEDEIRTRLGELKDLSTLFARRQGALDILNEIGFRLPLSSQNSQRLRDLNHRWQQLSADAVERYKGLQGALLLHEDFNDKCREWSLFLAQVEKDLASDIAGNLEALLVQQQVYENFQSEMLSRQQILASIIDEGHQMIQYGDVDDSADFEHKLEQLEHQWHSVTKRTNQRKAIIDKNLAQWQAYQDDLERLNDKLDDMKRGMEQLTFDTAPVQRIQQLVDHIKSLSEFSLFSGSVDACMGDIASFLRYPRYRPNIRWKRWSSQHIKEHKGESHQVDSCMLEVHSLLYDNPYWVQVSQRDLRTLDPLYQKVTDASRILKLSADPGATEQINTDLQALQDKWVELLRQLDTRQRELEQVLDKWRHLESSVDDNTHYLREVRHQLSGAIPEHYDDLQRHLQQCKELESRLRNGHDKVSSLEYDRKDLTNHISPEDLAVVDQRISLLRKQWSEMENQVVLRQQEIGDKVRGWTEFNDKYRHLMERLCSLEQRICNNTEFQIEDLLYKLEHDFHEQLVSLAGEKEVLSSRGQRLMRASSDVRAADIDMKLNKLADRWQHLQEVSTTRKRKLRETLTAVQQLDKSMAKLREWLAHIEQELSGPISYERPNFPEIQRHLHRVESLVNETQRHRSGVTSVLNLCDVLLQDNDACPSGTERRAIEQARDSLDKRWKNICSLATERRMNIESTWHQWQKWTDNTQRFEDWLVIAERTVKFPKMTGTFVVLKQELRNFEQFKNEVHNHLSELESLNRDYRQLAREGRTDTSGIVKQRTQDLNHRWDDLSRRTTAVLRRLRHTLNVKDDFDATRKALIVWLSDVDLRLTNLEFLKDASVALRIKNIKSIKDEMSQNGHRLQYIDKAGSYLMQKCDPSDSANVQRELDHFQQVLEQVLARLNKVHAKLHQQATGQDTLPFEEAAYDIPGDSSSDDSEYFTAPHAHDRGAAAFTNVNEVLHVDALRLRQAPEGLSRVPDYDLISSPEISSNEDDDFEDDLGLREAPEGQERWRMYVEQMGNRQDKLTRIEALLGQLEGCVSRARESLIAADRQLKSNTPVGPHTDTARGGYSALLSPAQTAVESLCDLEHRLQQETGVTSSDPHIRALVERFRNLQAEASEKERRLAQNKVQWAQLRTHVVGLQQWLGEAECVQDSHRHTPTDVATLQSAIRRHKEFLVQLDTKKPAVLSMNLVSKDVLSQPGTGQLSQQIANVNSRWDKVCAKAAVWQKELQIALLQSTEFHNTLQDLGTWLSNVERQVQQQEPVNFTSPRQQLIEKYNKFRELKLELEQAQPRVDSLQETMDQLLEVTDRDQDTVTMETRMSSTTTKLGSLLKICQTYMNRIENVADLAASSAYGSTLPPLSSSLFDTTDSMSLTSPPGGAHLTPRSRIRPLYSPRKSSLDGNSSDEIDNLSDAGSLAAAATSSSPSTSATPTSSRSGGLLRRVLTTSLPIQALMLLLLGVASLVPMCEDEFTCVLHNNFQRSFDPMLRYMDGNPPI